MCGDFEDVLAFRVLRADLDDACGAFGDGAPLSFLGVEFFDFKPVYSNYFGGFKPEYQFTTQFRVLVDKFFVEYLDKDTILVELYKKTSLQDHVYVGYCEVCTHTPQGERQRETRQRHRDTETESQRETGIR